MSKQTLNLINKNNRRKRFADVPIRKKTSTVTFNLVLGAGSNGNSTEEDVTGDDDSETSIETVTKEVAKVTSDSTKTDTQKQNEISDVISMSDSNATYNNMSQYINDMISALTVGNTADSSLNSSTTSSATTVSASVMSSGNSAQNNTANATAWDPRLARLDGFVSTNKLIVPFASATAAGAYYDEVYTIEQAVYNAYKNGDSSTVSVSTTFSGQNSKGESVSYKYSGSNKVAPNKKQISALQADPNEYGTQSLMNPYSVTKLVGSLTRAGKTDSTMQTHMYDIRDSKRFYDNAGSVLGGSIVKDSDDITSINNPTTTNIIAWSNRDRWGRTPYSFQDFVFCKYWNIIPNNRLITFRKYAIPTYDNLNFPGMVNSSGTSSKKRITAPIATVVTYFGGDSPNKLSDFLKFTTGTKWRDISADVHKVQGDTGSNPRAVIDKMFESGSGFGGVHSGSKIIDKALGTTGGLLGQYFSFGKFVGLLAPGGYSGHSQEAFENLTNSNVDPSDQLYSNKIIGPVNRVQSVKARDAGIEFSQSFTLVCEYVARPIGGINTKAAMLDILANCMEIASPEAVFWGGGYRFMIKPHMYPFHRGAKSGEIMDDLYAGRIFGSNGAIAHGLKGLLSFGEANGSGSFSWSTVTERLGEVLSQTVGAIGSMLQSIGSTLMGDAPTISSWLKGAGDALTDTAGDEATKKGQSKMNAMFSNLNKMWKDKVIQETTMPSIDGMKSILSGEPTGNWHMTLGNPLNPIMVVGNLICTKMDVTFGDELGPDDFPLEMKVTYTIEHGMARDKAGIQSMFNRGSGKIYKLPDYIKSLSDYETAVDKYTGKNARGALNALSPNGWTSPAFMSSAQMMSIGGAHGYQTYKITDGKKLMNTGDPKTTMIAKFSPIDPETAYETINNDAVGFLGNENARVTINGNVFTRKRSNN